MSCPVILAYITLSLSKIDQILKLVCDYFLYYSCYFISCQSIFLFLRALQSIAGVFVCNLSVVHPRYVQLQVIQMI